MKHTPATPETGPEKQLRETWGITRHTPATPLPWEVIRATDQRTGTMVCGGKPFNGATHAPAIVKRAGIGTHEDAAYIAHTANAYPKLVEALRMCDNDHAGTLLRELGEE